MKRREDGFFHAHRPHNSMKKITRYDDIVCSGRYRLVQVGTKQETGDIMKHILLT